MFRVRESLFGKSILQISDGDDWRDAFPAEQLKDGFNITKVGVLTSLYERLDVAETRLHDYAAAVNAARRTHKRLPVLTEEIV